MSEKIRIRSRLGQITGSGWVGVALLALGVLMLFGAPWTALVFFVLGGTLLWFGRLSHRARAAIDADKAAATRPHRYPMPWWGVVGWAVVFLVVGGAVLSQLTDSGISRLGGEPRPFLTPTGVGVLAAAFLLGLTGLIVTHLNRPDADRGAHTSD